MVAMQKKKIKRQLKKSYIWNKTTINEKMTANIKAKATEIINADKKEMTWQENNSNKKQRNDRYSKTTWIKNGSNETKTVLI